MGEIAAGHVCPTVQHATALCRRENRGPSGKTKLTRIVQLGSGEAWQGRDAYSPVPWGTGGHLDGRASLSEFLWDGGARQALWTPNHRPLSPTQCALSGRLLWPAGLPHLPASGKRPPAGAASRWSGAPTCVRGPGNRTRSGQRLPHAGAAAQHVCAAHGTTKGGLCGRRRGCGLRAGRNCEGWRLQPWSWPRPMLRPLRRWPSAARRARAWQRMQRGQLPAWLRRASHVHGGAQHTRQQRRGAWSGSLPAQPCMPARQQRCIGRGRPAAAGQQRQHKFQTRGQRQGGGRVGWGP